MKRYGAVKVWADDSTQLCDHCTPHISHHTGKLQPSSQPATSVRQEYAGMFYTQRSDLIPHWSRALQAIVYLV